MKRFFFLLVLGFLLAFFPHTFGKEMEQALSLNSNLLLDYIKDNDIKNITEFCTNDFCDSVRSQNIEKAIEIFKKKYQMYLGSQTDEETALSTILKGFPITEIKILGD